jgi:uncharacterized protein YndB with AHSA1/START domain
MSSKNETKIIAEPGKPEIIIIREFDAPRELVFKAHIDSNLYAQWLGPRELTTSFDKFEPRNGGSYRFINKDKEGNEYAFHGVYHEVKEPERLIGTFEFEGLPESGHVEMDTAKFEELSDGRTKLTTQAVYQSLADRDGMIQSDMGKGVREGYERLDELLEKMKN